MVNDEPSSTSEEPLSSPSASEKWTSFSQTLSAVPPRVASPIPLCSSRVGNIGTIHLDSEDPQMHLDDRTMLPPTPVGGEAVLSLNGYEVVGTSEASSVEEEGMANVVEGRSSEEIDKTSTSDHPMERPPDSCFNPRHSNPCYQAVL